MNGKQRRAILCGFVAILLMGLFPPWMATIERQRGECSPQAFDGYKLLVMPRTVGLDDGYREVRRVDASLLLVQWFLASAVTGVIVVFQGDRRRSPIDKPED